jgi:transcriptional regulator with GAF, ATPase, and Fis domain
MTRQHIKKALEISGCRIEGKKGAAQILGMNPSTLRSKMKKLGIVLKKYTG